MKKRYIVTILLLVAAVMLLAACSSSSGDAPEEVPVEEIQDITWEWAELIENNPAAQSVVPDPENYTLTFFADGTVAMKVDCNSGNGSYTVDGNEIEFGLMALTMAMCPPESLHDQFLQLLGEVDTFGMRDDKLVFTLKDEAGEMRFQNGG